MALDRIEILANNRNWIDITIIEGRINLLSIYL